MATTQRSRARFLEALLSPLPASEEQVATPQFSSQIKRDLKTVWFYSMEPVRRAEAEVTIAQITLRNSRGAAGAHLQLARDRLADLARAKHRQCLIAAPSLVEVRWKRRVFRDQEIPTDVAAAIARDEARLLNKEGR